MQHENLAGVTALASAYESDSRSTPAVSRGAALFGQIPLARGIRGSRAERPPLAGAEADWGLEARALFAANSLIPTPAAELARLRDSIARWQPHSNPEGSVFAYHSRFHSQVRSYLLGLLSVRLGESARGLEHAMELETLSATRPDSGLGSSFAHIVRAEVARSAGDLQAALQHVAQFGFDRVPPTEMHIFYASAHGRLLHAELLHSLGRDQEALRWLGSFPEPAARDLMYIAPGHLRRGELYERLGDRSLAIAHYSRFIRLWRDCDPELRPMVARAGLAVALLSGRRYHDNAVRRRAKRPRRPCPSP